MLRVFKRLSCETADEMIKVDRLDQNISVYDVPQELRDGPVQMQTEHMCSFTRDPPKPAKPRYHLDVRELPHDRVLDERGETKFAFTQQAHRCLEIDSPAGVTTFAEAVMARIRESRHTVVPVPDLKAYIRARREQGDPEWAEFLADPENIKWLEWLNRAG